MPVRCGRGGGAQERLTPPPRSGRPGPASPRNLPRPPGRPPRGARAGGDLRAPADPASSRACMYSTLPSSRWPDLPVESFVVEAPLHQRRMRRDSRVWELGKVDDVELEVIENTKGFTSSPRSPGLMRRVMPPCGWTEVRWTMRRADRVVRAGNEDVVSISGVMRAPVCVCAMFSSIQGARHRYCSVGIRTSRAKVSKLRAFLPVIFSTSPLV
jgi:hypothetical protein